MSETIGENNPLLNPLTNEIPLGGQDGMDPDKTTHGGPNADSKMETYNTGSTQPWRDRSAPAGP